MVDLKVTGKSADSHHGMTRRAVLKDAIAAAATLAIASTQLSAAASGASAAIAKTIPLTGEKLPAVGIGTHQYSVTAPEDIAARREVLRELPNLGGKVVDTAWGYAATCRTERA